MIKDYPSNAKFLFFILQNLTLDLIGWEQVTLKRQM